MAITLHLIDESVNYHNYLLEISSIPEKHTAKNLKDKFDYVLQKYDLQKNIGIVHDNTPNIVKAMSYYSNTTNIRCFAHGLQLCVNHAIKEPNIQEITKR